MPVRKRSHRHQHHASGLLVRMSRRLWSILQTSYESRRATNFESRWAYEAPTITQLLMLTPTEFEYKVADILRARGYRDVRRTGGAGDLNADIKCISPQGERVIVQCKRYRPDHKVGSPAVQTFLGMVVHHQAHVGIFVTTSTFTGDATDIGRKQRIQPRLELVDGTILTRWLDEVARYQHYQTVNLPSSGTTPNPMAMILHQMTAEAKSAIADIGRFWRQTKDSEAPKAILVFLREAGQRTRSMLHSWLTIAGHEHREDR